MIVGVFGLPGPAKASPGCQALNGQSGTIPAYGYVQLLTNSQQVNQGDAVTLTTPGEILYGGSFLQMTANGNTVSGTEGNSGSGADNLSNGLNSSTTYSITCTSIGATISGASPSSATAGSTVAISGTGFWGASQVLFGAIPATSFTVSYGATALINATVPNGSGTVTITVVTDAGSYTGGSFTFVPPTANPVNATVAYGSSNNAIPLSIAGPAIAVAVASAPAHGSATASGTSITYTPAAGYAGSDSFTYTASDAAGTSSPATVTITVNPPPIALSPATLPAMQDGVSFSQALAASGGTSPYVYSVSSGSLPAGLSLNSSTGALSGTPTYAGAYSFTIQARDSSASTGPYMGTQAYSGTVAAPTLALQPGSSLSAVYGQAYSQTFSASGGTAPYTYTLSGSLPNGLSFNAGTATLSGTPTQTGSFQVTVTATDRSTGSGAPFSITQNYTLTVGAASISMTPAALPGGTVGAAYVSTTLVASGGIAPYHYALAAGGSLPAGLVLSSAGTLSGTPTAAGSFNFSVLATDANGASGTQPYTVSIGGATLSISPATLGAAIAESGYSASFSTTGGTQPYTYAISAGSLPPGLSLSSSGTLSGTPTASGTYNFTLRSTDGSTGTGAPFSATRAYALQVNAPSVSIGPGTLPAPQMGTPYSQQLAATGGNGSYSFSIGAGALPAGLTLSSSGLLAGTPTVSGAFNVTVIAKDSLNFAGSQAYALNVGLPAVPTVAATSATTTYDTAVGINLSGAITGVDITAVAVATQPAHGTVSVSGETVTYTPSSTFYGGADSFTYTATNPGGTSTAATVTITVGAPAAPTVAAKSVTAPYNTTASLDLTGSISGVDITAVTIGTAPAHGTVSVSGEVVTYTPSSTYYGGADSFTYTATNPGGTSTAATVTITVGAPAAPTVAAKSVTAPYNTTASIDLTGSISGVDITAVTIGTAPAHGTVSVSGEVVTYTPSSTYYGGADSFTYTATSPGGTSAPATVAITVGVPAVPVTTAKSATTPYSTAASINLASSIAGVDITAVTVTTQPVHGTVSVSGEMVTYMPFSSFYGGTDSFTYTATNPGGVSTPAMVTMTVTPLNVPTVQAINVSTTAGTPVLVAATAMASGPQPLTGASVASAPAHGMASANGEQITYTPAAGFVGTDSFTYRVANHFGSSAPATVTVQVTAAGRLGSAMGTRTLTAAPGTAVTVNLAQIVPNAYVSSVLTGLSPGSAGSITLSQPATLTFTPTAGFRGLVQISATLTTASGRQVTIDVLVLVSSQPDPSRNPDVLGLVNAQAEQAQRFAQSTLGNIDGRLESLHDGGGTALFSNTLSISLDGQALQAPQQSGPGNRGRVDRDEGPFGTIARPGMGAAGGESSNAVQSEPSVGTLAKPAATSGSGPAGLGLWISGTANFGSYEAYRQASGFDSDDIAVNVGVDQRINPHALIGFSLGYNHDNADIASNGTRSIANGYSAALYGSYQPSAQTYVDLVLGGGGLDFGSRRYDADSGSFLNGRRNGSQWFGSLTAGYEYHNQAGLLLSPYLRLEQSLSELDGFSEQGAATAALSYGNQTVRTSLAVLGLRASEQLRLDWGTLVPRARLEIGHDFQGTGDTTLGYAFIPSAGSWNVLTNPYAANGTRVQLGLGLDLQLPRELRLTTDYEYLAQPHAHDQMIRFGLNKQF